MTARCDAESLFGVLINPLLTKPVPGVRVVGHKQMKSLGVDADRMPEWDYMSGQQKIEWLNLVGIGLTRVQRFKAFEQEGATNGSSPYCRKMHKLEFRYAQAAGLSDNHLPDSCGPIAVRRLRVGRV